jgi:hypothetical protein
MSALSWVMWLGLSVLGAAASIWQYRRRETPGRGRTLLALLRGAALSLLLLLVFDPELPGGTVGTLRGSQVLLDGSLSMQLPLEGGGTRWERGLALARDRAGERPIVLFGNDPVPVAAAALGDVAPTAGRSRLLPALQAAAEAGVRRVTVITDGGIDDADAVARWAARLGVRIDAEMVGTEMSNLAITEAAAPVWVQSGSPAIVEFGVSGETTLDSVVVTALRDGRVIGRATVGAPGPGRIATGVMELLLAAPPGGGWVPVELALERGDSIPDDDRRDLLIQVSDEPAGIALVSFRPDWEPRFLAPTLEQALGLPMRAYLRATGGQYVRVATGLEAGASVTEDEVRRAVARAEIVVLHNVGAGAPAWAFEALGSARRLLAFPLDDAAALPLPVQLGPVLRGDYFASGNVPASPVAPFLTDLEVGAVAPLAFIRSVDSPPPGSWTPLNVTRGRQGAPQPMVLAGETAGQRWAVALGSGYWQWAFRGGSERALYTRVWSALAGWLARERGVAAMSPVRPAALTTHRGAPVGWVAPGVVADSIAITMTATDGTVTDTIITPTARDTAFIQPPAPGHYRFHARAFAQGTVIDGEGVFAVERYSPEYSRPRTDLTDLSRVSAAAGAGNAPRAHGTPLHATPWPYGALILLLLAEWFFRRRWGLR